MIMQRSLLIRKRSGLYAMMKRGVHQPSKFQGWPRLSNGSPEYTIGAVIIFDKFHIINILNAATGEVCKREIRRCSSVQSIYE